MSEELKADLTLKDGVSDPAKKAAEALNKVEEAAKSAQKSGLDKFANSWGRIGMAAESSRIKEQKAFAGSWSKIGMKAETDRIRSADRAAKAATSAIEREKAKQEHKAKHESLLGGIKEATGVGKLASAAFIGATVADAFIEGAHKAVELLADGIKEAFGAAANEEKLRLSYRLMLGEKGGKEYMEEAERLSKLAGFSKSQTAEQIRPLLGAGMRGEKLTQSYALATDIAARKGGGSENVNAAIEALQRIELKGGISKKQLVGLGLEKNQDFFADIAKTLHVSQKTAEKMVEEGKVDSQVIINHLSDLVNKQQGGPGGTGGALYEKTFASRLDRLKNLPEEFFREMVDAPGFQVVSDKMGDILKQLDPSSPNGKKIIESMTNAMGSLADWVQKAFTKENIDSFATSVTELLPKIQAIASAFMTIVDGLSAAARFTSKVGEVATNTFLGGGESPDKAIKSNKDYLSQLKEDLASGKKHAVSNWYGGTSYEEGPGNTPNTPGPKPSSPSAPVTLTQNNTYHGTDPAMVEQTKKAGAGLVSELERGSQQGARPR